MNIEIPNRPRLLVLARHGQSLRNVVKGQSLYCPDTPAGRDLARLLDHEIPLTAAGEAQARKLGALLRARFGLFEKCYDSGYKRAVDTRRIALESSYSAAEIAAMRIRSELLLREREAGLMRNLTAAQASQLPLLDVWIAEYSANPFQTRCLCGESIADVADRVRQFRSLVVEHHSGEKVLVFCHELVMKAFRIVLLRQDVAAAIETCRQQIANCAVDAYRPCEGGWQREECIPAADD